MPIHGAGAGVIRGGGDGLSELRSGLVDALTAASAAPSSIRGSGASALVTPAFSIRGSGASALVTPAFSIRGSGTSALPMRALVAVSAAAAGDSVRQEGFARAGDSADPGITQSIAGARHPSVRT